VPLKVACGRSVVCRVGTVDRRGILLSVYAGHGLEYHLVKSQTPRDSLVSSDDVATARSERPKTKKRDSFEVESGRLLMPSTPQFRRDPPIPQQKLPSREVNTKQDRELQVFAKLLCRTNEKNRGLLFDMASKMARWGQRL
jgi:hypothetical protein